MTQDVQWFTDGAGYERLMARWTRAAGTAFLDWLVPPGGACWLDVGCGTGVFTELIVDTSSPSSVIAVDPSQAQIDLARTKPVAHRADFRVADAQTLPFSDCTFDIVVSSLVINFITDRPRALNQMHRVCKPGGVIAGYVWDFAAGLSPNSPIRLGLQQIGAEPPPVPGFEDSRAEGLTSLFAGSKLTGIVTKVIDVTMSYANFQDFWESQTPSYHPTSKMIAALSEGDREKVLASVRARLPAGPDGSVTHSARANAIKAFVAL